MKKTDFKLVFHIWVLIGSETGGARELMRRNDSEKSSVKLILNMNDPAYTKSYFSEFFQKLNLKDKIITPKNVSFIRYLDFW